MCREIINLSTATLFPMNTQPHDSDDEEATQILVDHLRKCKMDPRKFTFNGSCATAVMSPDGTYPDVSHNKDHPLYKENRFPGQGQRLGGGNAAIPRQHNTDHKFPGKGRRLG